MHTSTRDLLSVVIPARDEAGNIGRVLEDLKRAMVNNGIDYEIVVVNDGSTDLTAQVIAESSRHDSRIATVHRPNSSPGFGRAVRAGLDRCKGDIIALFMADGSDQPDDLIRCYRVMQDGWDCVFGSRFMRGSHTTHYPWLKLAINRLVNQTIRMMFWTSHNDMTNAFKLYRKHVIQACQPLRACHFNITIELSLGALIRGYSIARIPISWHGRTWGSTHLKLRDMGRRYLHTLLVMYSTRALVLDDIVVADERPQTPQKDPE